MAVDSNGNHGQPNFDETKQGNQAADLSAVSNWFANAQWTNWVPNVGHITYGGSHQWRYGAGKVYMRGYFSTPAPTGEPGWTMPVPADTNYTSVFAGTVWLYDSSAGTFWPALAIRTGATTLVIRAHQTFAAGAGAPIVQDVIGASSPFPWANGDSIQYELEYYPAS